MIKIRCSRHFKHEVHWLTSLWWSLPKPVAKCFLKPKGDYRVYVLTDQATHLWFSPGFESLVLAFLTDLMGEIPSTKRLSRTNCRHMHTPKNSPTSLCWHTICPQALTVLNFVASSISLHPMNHKYKLKVQKLKLDFRSFKPESLE